MGRRALLAVLAVIGLPAGCGSRTGLLLPGQGAAGGSGGSGSGGTTPLAIACNAALLDGAPTPTRGYCTTRANQAAANGPHAPTIAWSVAPFPIVSPEDYLPAETVVDASGRAYVAINASPQAPTGTPNQMFAVNADGSVAWTTTFDASTVIGALSLGRDGHLWFVQTGVPCTSTPCNGGLTSLTAYSPDGAPVASLAPSIGGFSQMAIASDGTFFVGQPELTRIATDGMALWQVYANFDGALVVGPDDDVVAGSLVYDASGAQLGVGVSADVTVVNAEGALVGLSAAGGPPASLVTFDLSGAQLLDVTVPSSLVNIDAYQLAVAGDGTALVLLADEASAPALTKSALQIIAIDPSGKTRWTTALDVTLPYDPADLTTHYGLFVDASGTVIVTAGTVMGLDLATGSVEWTLQPAKPQSCLRPAVLGAGGAIIATQCDGTVLLARDP
jgi:hypothetical protein